MKLYKVVFSKSKFSVALLLTSLTVGSCKADDLELARSFGDVSKNLGTLNQEISSDIYASCARAITWESRGTQRSRENMQAQLMVCDDSFSVVAQNNKIAGDILVDYVNSIVSIATEDDKGFDAQFGEISKALEGLDINGITINQNARNAGIQLANFIATILFRDFRRNALKAAIVCTDSDIQEYSHGLADFINESYVDFLLNREIEQLNEHYSFYLTDINVRLNKLSTNENLQDFNALQQRQIDLITQEREEVGKIIERKNKGLDYISVIRATANFHGELKQVFNDGQASLSPEQSRQCEEYHTENIALSSTSADETESLWDQEISLSELEQIKMIVKEYVNEVTPIFED